MKKDEVLKRLIEEFDENKNSHIFLVETNDCEKSLDDIKDIIKHKLALNDGVVAHQIDDESYLELTIIRPNGKEIKKDQIKELQDRLKTKPILSDYMFYIMMHAEAMSEISANKLLKTIEEPNQNIIGFLVTTNLDVMLPTVKSRCENISLIYEIPSNKEIDPDILNLTDKLIEAIEKKDHISFYKAKMDEKKLKDNYALVENLIKDYYNTACNLKKSEQLNKKTLDMIIEKNSYSKLIKKAWLLNKTLNKVIKNMNGDLLLEKIFIDLKGVE